MSISQIVRMLNTQHTPGPWKVHTEGKKTGILTSDNVDHVATVHNLYRQEANARLIAAAPELLEALAVFLAQYASHSTDPDREARPEIKLARAAIAKATTPND
jgi:hypothetical protein